MLAGVGLMFWAIYAKAWWGAIGVPLFIYGIAPRRGEEELTVNISEDKGREEPPKRVA